MKRFYNEVATASQAGGWQVTLDGRGIRTAGKQPQLVPTLALAEAMAAEWSGQGDEIDPSRFVLRDLADYAIDAVSPDPQAAVAELLPYAETDTLCYRAEPDDALHRHQAERWEPLLSAAELRWDIHFARVSGIIHRPQPAETLARLKAVLATHDPFALAALKVLASLSASLVIALAAVEPDADGAALWAASELEEDWQAELWGRDAEAEARREIRFRAFETAIRFARLARKEPASS